jgi:MSHA pilin protein MshD
MCTGAEAMKRCRGFTLAEMVLLVVVLAVGLGGIVSVYSTTVAGSADPLVRKQAMALAESLMEEILLQGYEEPTPPTAPGATRDTFDSVDEYSGYNTSSGIQNIYGAAVSGLGAYNYAPPVTVALTPLNGVADSKLVTVNVTGPGGFVFTLQGYKLKYP